MVQQIWGWEFSSPPLLTNILLDMRGSHDGILPSFTDDMWRLGCFLLNKLHLTLGKKPKHEVSQYAKQIWPHDALLILSDVPLFAINTFPQLYRTL